DVALQTRQQFYLTAGAYHLGSVANAAVRLARENERRVRALFDVGSVSRSDVLSAQVQTANSVLDSVTAQQGIVNQRVALARILAIPEAQLGQVDTILTAEAHEYRESDLVAEAAKQRPDLQAAEVELKSAKSGLT